MYCTDFEYAGERLSDHGLIICSFDGAKDLEVMSSGADITFNQSKPSMRNKFNLYSSVYESPYTTTFQICKNPCIQKDDGKLYFSPIEISHVQRWLCRKYKYHKFKIDQDGWRNIYWNATFTSKQLTLDGNIVGLELTMYTDSPYAYMDDITLEIDCEKDKPLTIYDTSDEEGYIYPYVEITCLNEPIMDDNGIEIPFMLEISNSRDNKKTRIKGCVTNEIIYMDGNHLIISSSNPSHDTLANDFNYFFPKIINTYENSRNDFTVNIDCKIKIKYSPVIKAGL